MIKCQVAEMMKVNETRKFCTFALIVVPQWNSKRAFTMLTKDVNLFNFRETIYSDHDLNRPDGGLTEDETVEQDTEFFFFIAKLKFKRKILKDFFI